MRIVAAALFLLVCSVAAASAQGMANPWGGGSSPLSENFGFYDDRSRICADDDVPYQRALESCRQIIEGASTRMAIAGALLSRGDRHRDEGAQGLADADYAHALGLYVEETAEGDAPARADVGRGAAHYRMQQYEAAEQAYAHAIRLDRGYAAAYWSRGITRFRRGDYTGAIPDFDRAAQLGTRMSRRGSMFRASPEAVVNPSIHAGRCEARAAAGLELETAGEACREAMRTSGGRYVFSRGFLHFRQGEFDAAYRDFQAALEEDEADGFALYARGVTSVLLGRIAEGEADIARAIEMEGEERLAYYANAGLRPTTSAPPAAAN